MWSSDVTDDLELNTVTAALRSRIAWRCTAVNILIHTRLKNVFDTIKTSLEGQLHRVDAAFTIDEGREKMIHTAYDKIFIGIGVPSHDRLSLMSLAGELGMSMVEIIDANTVTKEILMYTPSGKHRYLPEQRR